MVKATVIIMIIYIIVWINLNAFVFTFWAIKISGIPARFHSYRFFIIIPATCAKWSV